MSAEPRTISALAVALRGRRTTAEAVTTSCLARIAERNAVLNAFITVLGDDALTQAREADKEISSGRHRGPLHGVPISLKDLFDLEGTPTTAASNVRREHVARVDATVVARLRAAGAVLIGKTNLHEFAFGTTNEDSAFGPARHPLDSNRSPGGSSGGSAASVAAGMAYASIGTDTGGSVRIPAAACGLVGLKPGLAEIETDGVVPLSTTLDHVGPLCRSVNDAALVYDVIRGQEPATPEPCSPRGLRFGVPRPYFLSQLDPQVAGAFDEACARLADAGAVLEDVEIPHASDIVPIYLHIVLSEAAALHAGTLDSRPDDYTPNVRIRLEMGRYVLAEDYVRAMRGRDVLTGEVDAALGDREALLLPSLPIPAPRIGMATVKLGAADEPIRNVMLRLTQLFNITGHAAITLPCGTTSDGLPIGAQLVGGRVAGTGALLQVAAGVEQLLQPASEPS
jgi:aspartyl-tRNA(Asn)/glutamyl-tRNA(Gln) amidotransferase subunit A